MTQSIRNGVYFIIAILLTGSVVFGCECLNRHTVVTFENNTDDTLHDVVILLPDGERELGDVEAHGYRRIVSDGLVEVRYHCTRPDGTYVQSHTEVEGCESLTWINIGISPTNTFVTYRARTPLDLELKCQAVYDWIGLQLQPSSALQSNQSLASTW